MPIKNKIILTVICFFGLFAYNLSLHADEFNLSASEITFDNKNNVVVGKGSVEVTDEEGKLFRGDKVTYEKSKEFLLIEGSVEIIDSGGNILETDTVTYDKIKDIITTYENSELILAREVVLERVRRDEKTNWLINIVKY